MEDRKKSLLLMKRAIAIADSKQYDEDAVRRLLEKAEEEVEEAGLRRNDTGGLSEAA